MFFFTDSPEARSLIAGVSEALVFVFGGVFLAAQAEQFVSVALGSVVFLVVLAAYLVYLVVLPVQIGGTLAQRVFGVRIESDRGGPPTLAQSATRLAWIALEGLLLMITGPIGMVVLLLARRKRQRWWHDHRADTRLVWSSAR